MFILSGFLDEYSSDFTEQLEGAKRLEMHNIELRFVDGVNVANLSEEKVNKNDKAESKGEKYWGNTHALQIEQFYNSCLKKERLEISAEEALKTHKIVCDIYKKANVEMMK